MKIGIITQPLKSNYGGILQNWALQQTLIKLGHEPITIDYLRPRSFTDWRNINIYRLSKWLKNPKEGFKYQTRCDTRLDVFEEFARENICLTKTVHSYKLSLIKKYELDAIIVGSDQVWRPVYNEFVLEDMFLKFALEAKIKRISYAASFGTDSWEYNTDETQRCSGLIKKFDAVSVREKSGMYLCKNRFSVDAIQVLDPTLLLEKKDYIDLIWNAEALCNKPFLAAYILDPTVDTLKHIEDKSAQLGLQPLIIHADNKSKLTPIEWLTLFRDADYIITDSFHGSIFSILFEKNFEALGNSVRGNSRFDLINELKTCDIAEFRRFSLQWLHQQLIS